MSIFGRSRAGKACLADTALREGRVQKSIRYGVGHRTLLYDASGGNWYFMKSKEGFGSGAF